MEEDIFDLLKRLNKRITIIVVSHDIGFISEYVTMVACLNKTLVCHETASISGKTIEELYGAPVHMIQHNH
jgi:zinc transport system ATP-binding protein